MVASLEELEYSSQDTIAKAPHLSPDELGQRWCMVKCMQDSYKTTSPEGKVLSATLREIDRFRRKARAALPKTLSPVEQEIEDRKETNE